LNDITAANKSDDGWTGKGVTVFGKTEQEPFLDEMNFELSIGMYHQNTFPHFDNNELIFGYLEKHEPDKTQHEHPFISSSIPVSESDFKDLRNCLFQWAKISDSSLKFLIGLYGLSLGKYSIDEDKWPNGSKLQIIEFEYNFMSPNK
jgi:hypothetical protein